MLRTASNACKRATWSGMRRRLASILAAPSLLLALAAWILWILSWLRPCVLSYETSAVSNAVVIRNPNAQTAAGFYSMRGGLDVRYYWRTGSTAIGGPREWTFGPVTNPRRFNEWARNPPTLWTRLGFF